MSSVGSRGLSTPHSKPMKNLFTILVFSLFSVTFCEESIEYYETEEISGRGNLKEGKKDGKWNEYYQNGQMRVESNYKDGKEEGKWTYYNEDGSLKKVEEILHSLISTLICFKPSIIG